MWLGSGVAVAVEQASAAAPIQPLAWELPYAATAAITRGKEEKKKSSYSDAVETNLISIPEDVGSIPCLIQWVWDPALL